MKTIKQIRAEHLIVDPVVQRDLNMAWVKEKLREGFNPDGLGALAVSHRDDDTYHVMDGQHRRALCIVAGHGDILLDCIVYEGLNRSREAALFRVLNDRKSPQAMHKFRIAVVEGDPMYVNLNQMLLDNGWEARNAKTDGSFSSVASLVKVYQGARLRGVPAANPDVCETLIQILTAAWGHNSDAVQNHIVAGLGLVLLRYRDETLDIAKLITGMTSMGGGPRGLQSRAQTLYSLRGGTVADSVAEVLIEMHNKHKRVKAVPAWR